MKRIRNIVITIISLLLVVAILNVAKNYIKEDNKNKVNLVINNNNVTNKMKKDLYIDDNGVIYLSKEDITNYFDKYLDYDTESKRLTTTSDIKVATMMFGEKTIRINGTDIDIGATLISENGILYIPFSEISRSVYNVELEYIKDSKTIVVTSLDRELLKADSSKNANVKSGAKSLSKTVDKIKKGEKIVYISENDGWAKIRTERGKIGYVKKDILANIITVRQAMEDTSKIEGKVNLVWDYYSEYAKAPNRNGSSIEGVNVVSPSFFTLRKDGNGEIINNVGDNGLAYIQWAHENNYKVWAMFSNNSMLKTTSDILNDYDKREKLIDDIVVLAEKYNVDGINLDFENMNQSDKDVYSRFVIELAPRLKDTGKILSVDVTAPDGSETWSLCFDRNVIGDVADYIVFMAYDQYGTTSPKEGTTAGHNWVETNIKKFLGQEGVDSNKIILGIPFYTRLWKEENGKITSKTVDIKNVESVLPKEVQKIWNDDLKQYYVEYVQNGITYKMWIEDENSIKEKLNLTNTYKLAGVAFWEKDREPESIWKMIYEELNK